MKKKIINYLFFILSLLLIFQTSYIYKYSHNEDLLQENSYDGKKINVNRANKYSRFRRLTTSTYFTHPGIKKPSIALFTFNKDLSIMLEFSLKDATKPGNILYKVENNNKVIDTFVINQKNLKHTLKTKIKSSDKLKIVVDKNGSIAFDWGVFKIYNNSLLKRVMHYIPLITWLLFFIFMFYTRQLFFAIYGYLIFILSIISEKLTYADLTYNSIIGYLSIAIGLSLLFALLSHFKRENKLTKLYALVLSIIFAIPIFYILVFIIYYLLFNIAISEDIIVTILETNFGEAKEFILQTLQFKYIIALLATFIVTVISLYKIIVSNYNSKKNIFITITLLEFFILFTYTYYNNTNIFKKPYSIYSEYKKDIEEIKKLKHNHTIINSIKADKKESKETYIVVIGESLNKNHMGLYGYFRDTTPRLNKLEKKNNFIKFSNVYSNYVLTSEALTFALTQANQYNKKDFIHSATIIDVLNKLKDNSYWITNQVLLSRWDNKISTIATDATKVISLNKEVGVHSRNIATQHYDDIILPSLKKILNKQSNKNRVIFIHLMGSHVKYSSRYPKEFNKFSSKLDPFIFGSKVAKIDNLNAYDNSVYFNDYVISSIINILKKRKGVKGLVYFSDHADDVELPGHVAHNIDNFTYAMTQIPLIMWFSDEYRQKYKDKLNNLIKHKNSLYSNDLIYDTLLGIMNIQTQMYNSKYDLSSTNYKLDEHMSLVLHGKKHYNEKDNRYFWRYYNAKNIDKSKVVITHVNTIGKANELLNLGYKNFIIDTKLKDNSLNIDSNIFNKTINDFLDKVDKKRVNKVILNITNIKQIDKGKLKDIINNLINKYTLKNRLYILENSTIDINLPSIKIVDSNSCNNLSNLSLKPTNYNIESNHLIEYVNKFIKNSSNCMLGINFYSIYNL